MGQIAGLGVAAGWHHFSALWIDHFGAQQRIRSKLGVDPQILL